jgi:transcriptional regulator GlxA family with amidase domain
MGFFAVVPSRHRYYLPEDSPGWTFGWIGIYQPYFLSRITKQVATSGPVVHAPPSSPLIHRALRLVRGAFEKDFRDRFEVESELFALTLAFDRLAEDARNPQAEPLLLAVRQRVLADPRKVPDVTSLAQEHGLSRSAFGHFFRETTGQSPAHYMTEVRVEQAARLLSTTRLSLEDIARECGFANANHFGKVFRRFRHQSPSAFRHLVR